MSRKRKDIRTYEQAICLVTHEKTDENRVEAIRQVIEDDRTCFAFRQVLAAYDPNKKINLVFLLRSEGYFQTLVDVQVLPEEVKRKVSGIIEIKNYPVLLAIGTSSGFRTFVNNIPKNTSVCVAAMPITFEPKQTQ